MTKLDKFTRAEICIQPFCFARTEENVSRLISVTPMKSESFSLLSGVLDTTSPGIFSFSGPFFFACHASLIMPHGAQVLVISPCRRPDLAKGNNESGSCFLHR